MAKQWVFPPFATTTIFFKNRALSLLYPYGALTSCKKLEKFLERSLRYSKTDGRMDNRRTDMGDYIGPPRVNPGSKICILNKNKYTMNPGRSSLVKTNIGNAWNSLVRTKFLNYSSNLCIWTLQIWLHTFSLKY